MPSGTLCPSCGKPVMPYRRFLREAEPTRISRCSNCGVPLKRNRSVWLLLVASAAVAIPILIVGIPFILARWGGAVLLVAMILFTAVWTLVVNVCGWLFVGWHPADSAQSRAGPSSGS